jgi:hypothetical protein
MQMALIWGGMLMVMAPLYSMHTRCPTWKQQAFSVWTSTSWQVLRSHTSSSQQQTRRIQAFMVTGSWQGQPSLQGQSLSHMDSIRSIIKPP